MTIQQMLLGVGGGDDVEKTATLSYPSAHGQFYNTTAVNLSESDLTTGIELDTNDSSASTIAYPGAYKLVLGAAMTLEFHLWGGGSSKPSGDTGAGGGGYTKFVCTFSKDDEIGIYIAGYSFSLAPTTWAGAVSGGWPDGGTVPYTSNHGTGGAGSTRVGPIYADLSAMNVSTATYYAIAGGAGGPHMYAQNSAAGGGSSGLTAGTGDYSTTGGGGGTQSAGGAAGGGGTYTADGAAGAKYTGADSGPYATATYGGGGGGGGGYYGGGSGSFIYSAGGGGSGYIDTSHSGYQSGSTTAGTSGSSTVAGTSPAGSGVTKPTNGPGNANKNGGVIIKLN